MAEVTADQKTQPRKPSFLERLAEKVGVSANARAVYSEPVQHDGVTVIPVAKVRWGFGGGNALKTGKRAIGGGGGAHVSPMGYIEMKDGETQYRPIHDPASLIPLVAVGSIAGWILLRAIRKLIRG